MTIEVTIEERLEALIEGLRRADWRVESLLKEAFVEKPVQGSFLDRLVREVTSRNRIRSQIFEITEEKLWTSAYPG
jgi:hypothetical protein